MLRWLVGRSHSASGCSELQYMSGKTLCNLLCRRATEDVLYMPPPHRREESQDVVVIHDDHTPKCGGWGAMIYQLDHLSQVQV
jgi:hypothetical protein